MHECMDCNLNLSKVLTRYKGDRVPIPLNIVQERKFWQVQIFKLFYVKLQLSNSLCYTMVKSIGALSPLCLTTLCRFFSSPLVPCMLYIHRRLHTVTITRGKTRLFYSAWSYYSQFFILFVIFVYHMVIKKSKLWTL